MATSTSAENTPVKKTERELEIIQLEEISRYNFVDGEPSNSPFQRAMDLLREKQASGLTAAERARIQNLETIIRDMNTHREKMMEMLQGTVKDLEFFMSQAPEDAIVTGMHKEAAEQLSVTQENIQNIREQFPKRSTADILRNPQLLIQTEFPQPAETG